MLDRDVLTFDVTQLAQPLSKCFVEDEWGTSPRSPIRADFPGGCWAEAATRRGKRNEGKSGGREMHDSTDRRDLTHADLLGGDCTTLAGATRYIR
jgi:hypothetical protein